MIKVDTTSFWHRFLSPEHELCAFIYLQTMIIFWMRQVLLPQTF